MTESERFDVDPRIIFSTSADYFDAARQGLKLAFGADATIERLGRDTGAFHAPGIAIAQVAAACQRWPLVFIQHLMQGVIAIPALDVVTAMDPILDLAIVTLRDQQYGNQIALQVWFSDDPIATRYQADDLRRYLVAGLTAQGYSVTRGGQSSILSVCVTPLLILIGFNATKDALTDWPGGRVGLAKSAAQLSRAEFKLEELFKTYPLALPTQGAALDLGASPGGWTRLLRELGLDVWAVDPARLDDRLAGDPGVHHAPQTSAAFLAASRQTFVLIVNDMRMDPERSCAVMVRAARQMRPGGLAIMTLKLLQRDPLAVVRRSLDILAQRYEIVFTRQLFHNRQEVTVVARRSKSLT
jgi:23S rRNA (cytidine2498-2'-O)-methyltransferase